MSHPAPAKRARLSPALIGVGVLVVAIGFGLPQLMSGSGPVPKMPEAENAFAHAPASKKGAEPPAPITPPSANGIGVSVAKLLVGLLVVCGLCIVLARWIGPKPPKPPGAMEVQASIAVGRCVIHLVQAGNRKLLIGTDPAGVKALVELPVAEPPTPEPIPEATPVPDSGAPVPEAAPAEPAMSRDELLALLLRLRTRSGAPPSD